MLKEEYGKMREEKVYEAPFISTIEDANRFYGVYSILELVGRRSVRLDFVCVRARVCERPNFHEN